MRLRIVLAGLLGAAALAPAAAAGPRVDHFRVPSHDGVVLDGWVVRPPGEARRPVVLWSSPYFGQCGAGASLFAPGSGAGCFPRGDDPAVWDGSHPGEAVPVNRLLEHGYAVAMFSVRGTGGSGGCLEYFGRREQLDQAHLVEWLAARPWSNRRVAMMGLSYHGATALEAAIHRPRHLRAVVVGGLVSDPYELTFSPQGATQGGAMYDLQAENFAASYSLAPPAGGAAPAAGRLCPEVAEFATHAKRGGFAADRDPEFWAERRLADRFGRIRAAVLIAHGLQDLWGSGHKFAEDEVWHRIRAPKRMLLGQWGHEFPDHNSVGHPEWVMERWDEQVLGWLDRWLGSRRRGRAPRDRVDYQDSSGSWHRARSWPPRGAVEATMPLTGTFRSQPRLDALFRPERLLCLDEGEPPPPDRSAVVEYTDPLRQDLLVAGNPSAELSLSSDQPGGQVSVNLFDVPPGATCDGASGAEPRRLTLGAADLRFHHGGARPRPFPAGSAQGVHVDLANLAAVVPAGHRIAAVASFGEPSEYETFPHMSSRITLHRGSRVVLPLLPPRAARPSGR